MLLLHAKAIIKCPRIAIYWECCPVNWCVVQLLDPQQDHAITGCIRDSEAASIPGKRGSRKYR